MKPPHKLGGSAWILPELPRLRKSPEPQLIDASQAFVAFPSGTASAARPLMLMTVRIASRCGLKNDSSWLGFQGPD
jgi:hypothetical protein